MKCNYCGTTIPEGSKKCNGCGKKVEEIIKIEEFAINDEIIDNTIKESYDIESPEENTSDNIKVEDIKSFTLILLSFISCFFLMPFGFILNIIFLILAKIHEKKLQKEDTLTVFVIKAFLILSVFLSILLFLISLIYKK